nr:PRC-barrel domain-containing protein [Sphingomonas lenta]
MKLQTDESVRLISSSKVEGTPVVGRNGESLGKIQSFMVDKYTGRVAYAVMSFGGTMGFGESLFPLPWDVLTYDTNKDGYVLALTKEQLADAPRFTASDAPEFDVGYRRSLAGYYNR